MTLRWVLLRNPGSGGPALHQPATRPIHDRSLVSYASGRECDISGRARHLGGKTPCALGPVHTSGMKSLWGLFKREFQGTHHSMSPKHLYRCAVEFANRHNDRVTKPHRPQGYHVLENTF